MRHRGPIGEVRDVVGRPGRPRWALHAGPVVRRRSRRHDATASLRFVDPGSVPAGGSSVRGSPVAAASACSPRRRGRGVWGSAWAPTSGRVGTSSRVPWRGWMWPFSRPGRWTGLAGRPNVTMGGGVGLGQHGQCERSRRGWTSRSRARGRARSASPARRSSAR